MRLFKTLMITGSIAALGLSLATSLPAAPKKHTKAKASAKAEPKKEAKLLAKTADYPSSYDERYPEILLRATVVDFKPLETNKEFELTLLPLEVLKNPNHFVKMDHYKNGITLKLPLLQHNKEQLKKGGVLEVNQYTKDIPGETVGKAQLISTEFHQEVETFDVSPIAYLTHPGFESEQMLNAMKGILIFQGSIAKSDELKKTLDTLSKDKNSELSETAKKVIAKVYGN